MLFARQKFAERLKNLIEKAKGIDDSIQQITRCIAEIDGALNEGKPTKPWHTFFTEGAFSSGKTFGPSDRERF